MSYDLFVFDPSHAPTENEKFRDWFDETMDSCVSTLHFDFAELSPRLAQFYQLMQKDFPDMNPADPSLMDGVDLEDPYTTNYLLSESAIFISFTWSVGEDALNKVFEYLMKLDLGLFDASSDDGEVVIF